MGLRQVQKTVITSSTSDVQLDAINSDNVYVVIASGIHATTDGAYLQYRVTKDVSGTTTTQSGNSYKNAFGVVRANADFSSYKNAGTPRTEAYFCGAQPIGNATGEKAGGIWYLHNFNKADEYSYIIAQDYQIQSSGTAVGGNFGTTVFAVAEAHNGISFSGYSTNIDEGTFTMYELV